MAAFIVWNIVCDRNGGGACGEGGGEWNNEDVQTFSFKSVTR